MYRRNGRWSCKSNFQGDLSLLLIIDEWTLDTSPILTWSMGINLIYGCTSTSLHTIPCVSICSMMVRSLLLHLSLPSMFISGLTRFASRKYVFWPRCSCYSKENFVLRWLDILHRSSRWVIDLCTWPTIRSIVTTVNIARTTIPVLAQAINGAFDQVTEGETFSSSSLQEFESIVDLSEKTWCWRGGNHGENQRFDYQDNHQRRCLRQCSDESQRSTEVLCSWIVRFRCHSRWTMQTLHRWSEYFTKVIVISASIVLRDDYRWFCVLLQLVCIQTRLWTSALKERWYAISWIWVDSWSRIDEILFMMVQHEGKVRSCQRISHWHVSMLRKPKLPKSLIFDRRVLPQALSNDEKLKHQYFTQRYHDEVRIRCLDPLRRVNHVHRSVYLASSTQHSRYSNAGRFAHSHRNRGWVCPTGLLWTDLSHESDAQVLEILRNTALL